MRSIPMRPQRGEEGTVRGTRTLLLVTIAAFVLRLGVVHSVGFEPGFFDVDGYHAMAIAGRAGPLIPTSHHPPGYAWALSMAYAALGVRPRLVYLLQALLGAAAVHLVGDGIRRTAGERAGIVAAALLAFNAYALLATPCLASENLALPGVALVLWLSLGHVRQGGPWRLLAAAGVVCGLALVRTGLVLLAVPIVVQVFLCPRRAAPARRRRAALAAGILLVSVGGLFAHAARRASVTGTFRIGCPNDVYNLWVGNNPDATGRIDPMPAIPGAALDKEAQARLLAPRVREFVLSDPVRQVPLFLARASFNFAPPKRDLLYIYGHGWAGERDPRLVLAAYAAVALSLPILASAVLLGFARAGHLGPFRLAAAIALAVILPYQLSIGDPRFLLPAYPALCGAGGLLGAKDVAGAWSRRRRAAAALAMILFTANAVRDVALTDPALRALARPGGSRVRPPYHFAR